MDDNYKLIKKLQAVSSKGRPNKSDPLKELSPTKKKAQAILKAQELMAQKTRLECLLSQQFIGKYGSKKINSSINDVIIKAVKEYTQNNDTVQPESLENLESKISYLTDKIKNEIIKEKDRRISDINIKEHLNSDIYNKKVHNTYQEENSINIDSKNWSILNTVMAVTDSENERKKQEQLRLKKIKFKIDLDCQKAEVDKRKSAEKKEGFIYAEYNKA